MLLDPRLIFREPIPESPRSEAELNPYPGSEPLIEHDHQDDEPLLLPAMKMTQPAYRQTMEYLLAREPESAGLLIGPADDDVLITHFVPDRSGHGTPVSFELDARELNRALRRMKPAGLNCKGIVHSHPSGMPCPSSGDLHYLRRLFDLPKNANAVQFYLPIVCAGRMFPYVFTQGRVFRAELIVV